MVRLEEFLVEFPLLWRHSGGELLLANGIQRLVHRGLTCPRLWWTVEWLPPRCRFRGGGCLRPLCIHRGARFDRIPSVLERVPLLAGTPEVGDRDGLLDEADGSSDGLDWIHLSLRSLSTRIGQVNIGIVARRRSNTLLATKLIQALDVVVGVLG